MTNNTIIIFFILFFLACDKSRGPLHNEDHEHHSTNYVTKIQDLKKIDAGNGEYVFQMEGKDYNFESLSFAITETHPGGGPPIHTHETEEAHVLMKGRMTYYIDDSTFTVDGPYIANVPAGVPHTFINSGDTIINLIAVFPQDSFGSFNPIGKNPLLNKNE